MVEVSSLANDPWVGFRTRHPDFDYGFRRGIETSKFLARDERDFEEMKKRQKEFENAFGRVILREEIRKPLEEKFIAKLSSAESENYDEHRLPTGAALFGYMLGLAAPLMGREVAEHAITLVKMLKGVPGEALKYITEQIVAATHPPMSVVHPSSGRDPKLVILNRLRIKSTIRSLPEITRVLSREVEDVMQQHKKNVEKMRIMAVLAGDTRKMLAQAHRHLIRGDHTKAQEVVDKHLMERHKRNLPVAPEIEILKSMIENGRVNDAMMWAYHLSINAAKTEVKMKDGRETATPDNKKMIKRLRDAVGETDLVDVGKAIDLTNLKKISHWLKMDEDVLREIEDIFDKKRYNARHLMNLHMTLDDPAAREVLTSIIRQGDRELAEMLVKIMAETHQSLGSFYNRYKRQEAWRTY